MKLYTGDQNLKRYLTIFEGKVVISLLNIVYDHLDKGQVYVWIQFWSDQN